MASIARDKGGNRRILFVAPNGKRPTIRLGKVSQRAAEAVKFRVEQLLAAKLTGQALEADTARWIADLPDALVDKLARVGLIPSRTPQAAAALGPFIESYISRRTDVSPDTRRIWQQTARRLAAHFGANKPLAEITRGGAADWRLTLVSGGLADASVRKHSGFAKHFFAQAVDHELIPFNPFGKLVSSPVGNESRQYFVTREQTRKILDAAPCAQWRLIIALSRYGGLRCPSEHVALTWDDVDWAGGKLTVHSPKTAHHPGGASRVIPLFPELRPYLEESFDQAEAGTEYILTRYRHANANLRTQLSRIIRRAGLKPWPRITQNLRASRATELAADYPAHVAAAWLGHSTLVAQKHYWTVTDADFERACQDGAECGAREAQIAAQQAHAGNRNDTHEQGATPYECASFATSCESLQNSANEMAEVHGTRTSRQKVGACYCRGGTGAGRSGGVPLRPVSNHHARAPFLRETR